MLPRTFGPDADKRQRQIDTLKVFNSLIEIKENDEYRVEFQAGGQTLSLDVILGPQFPNERPKLYISPYINHPWVAESNAIIGAPALIDFNTNSSLAEVVQDIIREFEGSHPYFIRKKDDSYKDEEGVVMQSSNEIHSSNEVQTHISSGVRSSSNGLTSLSGSGLLANVSNAVVAGRLCSGSPSINDNKSAVLQKTVNSQGLITSTLTSPSDFPYPTSHSSQSPLDSSPEASSPMFTDLLQLSTSELMEMAVNVDLQDRFIETTPQMIASDLEMVELMANIEELAKDNLNKQKFVENFKAGVMDRIRITMKLKENFEMLSKKHEKLCEHFDPYKIKDALYRAGVEADEAAEVVVDQFLLGNISADSFVEHYTEKRALGQMRRTREERLAHQLAQLTKAVNTPEDK